MYLWRYGIYVVGLAFLWTCWPAALPAQSLAPGAPAREYIFTDGRLLAVETADNGAPGTLTATATSTSQVNLTWSAPAAGTPDHYSIWRRTTGSYSQIDTTTGTSYSDTSVSSTTTYLYEVAAVYSTTTNWSNVDIATTIVFTDEPLTVGSTAIKADHLTELRNGVNAVRTAAGLSAATWTDSSLSGVAVKAVHFSELRSNLNSALSTLGLSTPTYTDSTLTAGTTQVKKVHVEELRHAIN